MPLEARRGRNSQCRLGRQKATAAVTVQDSIRGALLNKVAYQLGIYSLTEISKHILRKITFALHDNF